MAISCKGQIGGKRGRYVWESGGGDGVGLYKIFVYFEPGVHESTIPSTPPPTSNSHPFSILLHKFGTVYESPADFTFVCYTPYNISYNYRVKANDGGGGRRGRARRITADERSLQHI